MDVWRPLRLSVLALAMIGGCRWVSREQPDPSLFGEPRRPSDRVELEIIFVKLPPQHEALCERLWQQVDEQTLSVALRNRLHENGFRVGLLSGQLPPELTRLLGLTGHSNPLEQSVDSDGLAAEPTATMRLLQTRSGRRVEVIASHVYDQLPLLTRVNGQLQGKSFDRAEARFELTAAIQENGQVQLVASPELQYGNAQLKFVGGDGVLRPEPSRPTRVFDELKTAALLNPGQMLILSSLADCPGSVGHYFFTQPIGDNLAQKFIIIRLANIGPKPLFDDEVEPPQSAISEAAPDESASPR